MTAIDPNSEAWRAFAMSVRIHHGHVLELGGSDANPEGGKCSRCGLNFTPVRRLAFGWMTDAKGDDTWAYSMSTAQARRCPGVDVDD